MFECIILGDSGSGNDDQYKVAKSMAKLVEKNSKISSVIIVGDNIYPARLTLVEKDAKIKEIGPFIAIKFPDRAPPKPGEGPKNIWLFEVSPR